MSLWYRPRPSRLKVVTAMGILLSAYIALWVFVWPVAAIITGALAIIWSCVTVMYWWDDR